MDVYKKLKTNKKIEALAECFYFLYQSNFTSLRYKPQAR